MNVHQDSNARNRENGGNTENAVSTVSKAFPDCDSRKATAMMIEQTEHRQRDWRTYEGRVVTKAQEARLIRKAKGRKGVPPDERARRELVKQMLPLVAWQAKKHVGLGVEFKDLLQEGSLAVLQALDAYTPQGAWFASYARLWIHG
jgi:DNA-directed RNA polymerase sigma subunit (sigma70/sigma32)